MCKLKYIPHVAVRVSGTLAVKCQLKPNEFNSSDKFKLAPTEMIICFELSPVMDHQFPNESTKKKIY